MTTSFSDTTDKIDVKYVVQLARLDLRAEELTQYQAQLEQILGYVNQLQALDLEDVEPTAHALPAQNVMREDTLKPSLDHDLVMANAPAERTDLFIVPKIVE